MRTTEGWRRNYAVLWKRKQQLQAELKELQAELTAAEERVLDGMVEDGIDRVTAFGVTLCPSRRVYVGRPEGMDVLEHHELLEELGLEEFAVDKVNYQGLSGYIHEISKRPFEEGEPIDDMERLRERVEAEHPGLWDALKVSEKFRVGARRAEESVARRRMTATKGSDEVGF